MTRLAAQASNPGCPFGMVDILDAQIKAGKVIPLEQEGTL